MLAQNLRGALKRGEEAEAGDIAEREKRQNHDEDGLRKAAFFCRFRKKYQYDKNRDKQEDKQVLP